ncbi:MAG: C25 family peptidase propeptide domain-containing protein, partial [Calditrichota bacterium]
MLRYILLGLIISAAIIHAESRITGHSPQTISIDFTLSDLESEAITLDGTSYTRLNYKDARFSQQPGAPLLPYSVYRVAIPPGASVKLQYSIQQEQQLSGQTILPAVVLSEIDENSTLPIRNDIYSSSTPYPSEIVTVSKPYRFRQMNVVDVKVYPIQYFAAEQRVRALKRISIQLMLRLALLI